MKEKNIEKINQVLLNEDSQQHNKEQKAKNNFITELSFSSFRMVLFVTIMAAGKIYFNLDNYFIILTICLILLVEFCQLFIHLIHWKAAYKSRKKWENIVKKVEF